MLMPAAITNETVGNFVLTVSAQFCESVNTERAYRDLEWLKTQQLGWSVVGFRPTISGLFTFLRYLGTAMVTILGALLN